MPNKNSDSEFIQAVPSASPSVCHTTLITDGRQVAVRAIHSISITGKKRREVLVCRVAWAIAEAVAKVEMMTPQELKEFDPGRVVTIDSVPAYVD